MSDCEQTGKLARTLLRVPVPWVFVLTYLVGAGLEAAFHIGGFLRDYNILTPTGSAVFVLGAALAAWGWLIFHRARTTRVPGETSTTLVTWGPYRFPESNVRRSRCCLSRRGWYLHQVMPVILLPLTIAYLNQAVIPLEEERLHTAFGAQYERYGKKVRRWL